MNVKYRTFRRVRITAPMSERDEVLDWMYGNNYSLKFASPKPIGPGRVDMSRLVVVAEKEIQPRGKA